MYDPTMRVLTVLEMLQAYERVTGAQLAERLEVHPRTAQRYVARLQDLGVPVTATRGVGGAYFLKPGFRLPPMMFSEEEALALLLGLRAVRDLGLSAFAPATEGAGAKLRRVLPTALAERVQRIQDTLNLELPWMVEASARRVIELASAVHQKRVVKLFYSARRGAQTQREVEPYGVIREDGRWYVLGWCRMRAAQRCFRIDRINDVETLGDTFEPPAEFDVRVALRAALASAPFAWLVRVWAELPLETVKAGLPSLRPEVQAMNTGTLLECGVEDLEGFAAQLLGLRCRLIVHHPPELRAAFQAVGARAWKAASLPISEDQGVESGGEEGSLSR
ncbi:helix-turn-helix transcriptional regulator [Deinococcus oregonensis]|uniref:Helix-turn-helix transcriptional regulator n=1 Tax=Deinococcus oregonensis TaxID=1805970 RepID=A0ABV6B2A8_9DEIO